MTFFAADPKYEARVRESFARQGFMRLLGAEMTRLEPGVCELTLHPRPELCQQHGYVHAGATAAIADTAAGYAGYSLMPADSSVLTVEFKLNLLAPAAGSVLIARARVRKPGRTLTVVDCDVVALQDGAEKTVATLTGTLLCLRNTADA
ncbi:MAG TPA: PaaI family thioesterase [Burkholderiaceae bacterium]|jgi:uncharacterized protein (TIGR00369 family)|nr:PaaI family thioesterase [Burkholderiaceae bacterium]